MSTATPGRRKGLGLCVLALRMPKTALTTMLAEPRINVARC